MFVLANTKLNKTVSSKTKIKRSAQAIVSATLLSAASMFLPVQADQLTDAVNAEHRTASFSARDRFRHPEETLRFMGIKPDMSVVEIWPAGGWWSEILAPYLAEQGTYYAAHFPAVSPIAFHGRSRSKYEAKLAEKPEIYGKVKVTTFYPPEEAEIAPDGSADAVLTFRNVHNWIRFNYEQKAFDTFYKALKPGGILGVVEHRAHPEFSREQMDKTGYVTEAYTIALAEKAGFVLERHSEVNANPKDTKDHPKGVWTLPPTFALKDQDKEKYQAIGESDRFTLVFKKPI